MAKKKIESFDLRAFLATAGAGRTTANYNRGRVIFRQGDPGEGVFFIEKGKVKITVTSKQGREGVIAILEPGDFFGEGCIAGQPLHMATAGALTDTAIVKVAKPTMMRLLRDEPDFSRAFMDFLLSRNIQFEADLVDQLFNSSEKRLARLLLVLGHFGKDGKMETIIPRINQDVLAARVGTTRTRINHFMNKFRKLGLIEYNGDLKIHSSLLNVILHD